MSDSEGIIRKGRIDTAAFLRSIQFEPHSEAQRSILYAGPPHYEGIVDSAGYEHGGARWIAVQAGVRFGKSTVAGIMGLRSLLEPSVLVSGDTNKPVEVWAVGPTADKAKICWEEIVNLAQRWFPEHVEGRIRTHEGVMKFRNLAGQLMVLRRMTASVDRSDMRAALTAAGHAVYAAIVDEASGVPDDFLKSGLLTRLADYGGFVIAISTPREVGPNHWHTQWIRRGMAGEPGYFGLRAPTWCNTRIAPSEILAMRETFEDWRFEMEVAANPVDRTGLVFDRVLVDQACNVVEFEQPQPGVLYRMSYDVALSGADRSVVMIARDDGEKLRVVHAERWSRMSASDQIERVARLYEHWNSPIAIMDASGLGSPMWQMLTERGCSFRKADWSAKGKSKMVSHLALLMQRKLVDLPHPDLMPEVADELREYRFLDEVVSEATQTRKMGAPSGCNDDAVAAAIMLGSLVSATGAGPGAGVARKSRGYDYGRGPGGTSVGSSIFGGMGR